MHSTTRTNENDTATDMPTRPALPNGWEWQGGSRWLILFGTEYDQGGPLAGVHGLGGYSGRLDADGSGTWWVNIRPVKAMEYNGYSGDVEPNYGFNVVSRSFRTRTEAIHAVPEIIKELRAGA